MRKAGYAILIAVLCLGVPTAQANVTFNDGEVHIINSYIPNSVSVYDGATPPLPDVTSVYLVAGGVIGNNLGANENSQITISGGKVEWELWARGSSQVTINVGSRVAGYGLYAIGNSQVTVTGGVIGWRLGYPHPTIHGENDGRITFVGTNFSMDGISVGYGEYKSIYGLLTGTLASGEAMSNRFTIGDNSTLILAPPTPIPAPGAIILGSIGIGFIRFLRRRQTI